MKNTPLVIAGLILIAIAGSEMASAQARRWRAIAELPALPTAIRILDDSTTLIGTATPSLILVQGNQIAWEMRLDTSHLPYFNYPHGMILDILALTDSTVMVGFQFGHARLVNIVDRTTREIEFRPINYLARSGDGTIVAGNRFRSTDNGTTWDTINYLASLPAHSFISLAGGSDGNFYGIPDFSGLWRSTDGGVTWAERDALRQTADSLTVAGPPLFVYDERTVVVFASDSRTMEGRNNALYKTTNDGESWRSVLPLSGSYIGLMSAYDDTEAFVSIEDSTDITHMYTSSDIGETWTLVDDGLPQYVIWGVMDARKGKVLAAILGSKSQTLYQLDALSSAAPWDDSFANTFSIYPNPVRRNTTIHVGGDNMARMGEIVVVNSYGSVVATWSIKDNSIGTPYGFDIGDLVPGFYMIELREGTTTRRTKLIVLE